MRFLYFDSCTWKTMVRQLLFIQEAVFSPNPMWYYPNWPCDFQWNMHGSIMKHGFINKRMIHPYIWPGSSRNHEILLSRDCLWHDNFCTPEVTWPLLLPYSNCCEQSEFPTYPHLWQWCFQKGVVKLPTVKNVHQLMWYTNVLHISSLQTEFVRSFDAWTKEVYLCSSCHSSKSGRLK